MIYNGSFLLLFLKIKDVYEAVGGVRLTKLIFANKLIDSSNISSGAWQNLVEGGGAKYVEVRCVGAFSNSKAEQKIAAFALSGEVAEYKIIFADKKSLKGCFQISYYERSGNINNEEQYVINLSSSGEIRWY